MSKPESEFTKPSDLCTVKNQPRDGSGPRTSAFCRNIAHISRLSLKNSFVSALNSEPQKTKLGRSRALLYDSTNRLTECRRTPFCVKGAATVPYNRTTSVTRSQRTLPTVDL